MDGGVTMAVYPEWVELIDEELAELDGEGMEPDTCTVIKLRGTDRLIEGETKGGDIIRGWLIDGESINDIRWQWEEIDGWPEIVRVEDSLCVP
jgi:hypothetical protein